VRFRRRYLVIPILFIALSAVLVVRSNTLTPPTPQRVQRGASSPSSVCSSQPLAGVYNPLRFRVLSNCERASGVVRSVTLQENGDRWIDVSLDAQYTKLLNAGNVNYRNGLLVLELTSQDSSLVLVPSVGQDIGFVGPLVYDTENQWNSICPVRSIQGD